MLRTILFGVLLVGCSKKESADGGKVASCLSESIHSCVEYRGGNLALGTENLAKLCTVVVSTSKFTETPCPTANVIATCQRAEGKDFYYQGYEVEPVADIEKGCKERGGTSGK